jgi:hypothetical protein
MFSSNGKLYFVSDLELGTNSHNNKTICQVQHLHPYLQGHKKKEIKISFTIKHRAF